MAKEPKAILCPYCGLMQTQSAQPAAPAPPAAPDAASAIGEVHVPTASGDSGVAPGSTMRCAACGGLFDHLSRKATQIAMGPWYIRDKANPFRPGCAFDVLKKQIEAGRIKPTTVLRGPTTRQFWAIARNVPGVGHLLGYCPRCGTKVPKSASSCPECAEMFIEPDERNELGLAYPSKSAVEVATKQLERELEGAGRSITATNVANGSSAGAAGAVSGTPGKREPWEPGLDLLDEVIGSKPLPRARSAAAPSESPGRAKLAAMSGAATTPAVAKPAPLKLGAALDFGPSDAEADHQDDAPPPPVYAGQNRNMQLVIWLLVAVNLLLLPILIGALLYFLGVFSSEPEVTQPSQGMSLFIDEFTQPQGAVEAPVPRTLPQAPAAAQPAPSVAPPPNVPAAPVAPAPTTAMADSIRAALAQAQRLEDAGELTQAITLLKDIQQKTQPHDGPADLAARIQRIQDKIDRSESARFFGMPVNPNAPAQ